MSQEGLDDDPVGAMGSRLTDALGLVRLLVRVVNGLVIAVRTVQPFPGQAPEVVCGSLGSTMAARAVA